MIVKISTVTTSHVQFGLTRGPLVSWRTGAGEGGDLVDTGPRVLTGAAQTLVHIQLALFTFKPGQTQALVPIVQVQAGGVVPTGRRLTLIDIDLTVDSGEASQAFTFIAVDLIFTDSAIFTGSQFTLKRKISFKRSD